MNRQAWLVGLVVVALAGFFVAKAYTQTEHATALRWLLPHSQEEIFDRSTETFAKIIADESDGTLSLGGTLYPSDLDIPPTDHFTMKVLELHKAEIVSDYIEHIGSSHSTIFNGLAMPFLFDDYESALKFLDGPKANMVLDTLAEHTPYKALAFTMSGGFRIFVSHTKPIYTPADIQGMRIWSYFFGGPQISTLISLGATPVFYPLGEPKPDPEQLKTVEAVETTYSRIGLLLTHAPAFPKYVTETNHGISLTVIVVEKKFFDSLSSRQQKALQKAAHEAAVLEKQDSVAYEEQVRNSLRKAGVKIITLTPAQRGLFKEATQPVYSAYTTPFEQLLKAVTESRQQ